MLNKFLSVIFSKVGKISVKNVTNSKIYINVFGNQTIQRDDNSLSIIRKKDLVETDKINFVNVKKNDFLIKRFYFDNENKDNATVSYFFDEHLKSISLEDIVEENRKLILLGNPGLGKTTELEQFANNLWNNKENEYVPIFRNLKNFTNLDTIENYIIIDWNKYSKLIFILDGIDEIPNIQDFISKIETFIKKLEIDKRDFKFLLSCRTNIYDNIVKVTNDFKLFYLKELKFDEGKQLLTHKCGNVVESFTFNDMILNFLKNPFQIEILANYINLNGKLPTNVADLWESYVNARLVNDSKDKSLKNDFNIHRLKKYSKKSSLINELMKTNVFSEAEVFKIVNEDDLAFKEFIKNPLTEKQVNSDNYSFEHRNLQEYFAALLISEQNITEIKDFILIKGTNKTHPSLFNTITFLLNTVETAKSIKLVDWFIDNEPELLFNADSNRIDNQNRVKIFQNYFTNNCVEKSYWITTNNTFSVKEIAEFGDCKENYDFLIKQIEENRHFRIVISAIELLSFFNIRNYFKEVDFKVFLVDKLRDFKINKIVKARIIYCINLQAFCEIDEKYLKSIFNFFKEESNKELNNALLSLLVNNKKADDFYWFIKNEFLLENDIKKRDELDEVIRGNRWNLENLIINLNLPENFSDIIQYYFSNEFNIYRDVSFEEKIVDRCLFFINKDQEFILKILNFINSDFSFHRTDDLIKKLLFKSNSSTQKLAYEFILKNSEINKSSYFLASITNDENINIAIDNFLTISASNVNEIQYFRNFLANQGKRELAKYFNDKMINGGHLFKDEFPNDEQLETIKSDFENKSQVNFDLLFEKDSLINKIEEIFKKSSLIEIDTAKITQIKSEWYTNNGHWNLIDISYSVLATIIYSKSGSVGIKEVKTSLDDEFIIKEIKSQIERNKGNSNKFLIKKEQIKYIKKWCIEISKKLDFHDIMNFISANHFSIGNDYHQWQYIMYFENELGIILDKDFYLNSLSFFSIDQNYTEKDILDDFSTKIDDKKTFDKKIIENLKSKKLFSFALEKHIKYALKNNLDEVFTDIKLYLLLEESLSIDNLIDLYFTKTNDISLLEDCCNNIEDNKCWKALDILKNIKEKREFCIEKAIFYLESIKSRSTNYYVNNAFNILFELKSNKAVDYYLKLIEEDLYGSFGNYNYSNYSEIENYNIIEELFNKIYSEKLDRFQSSNANSFLSTYISNLSKKDENSYSKTIGVLNKIKVEREKDISENKSGLFYVNLLIDSANENYINSKSKPLSFNEALKKVEEILN